MPWWPSASSSCVATRSSPVAERSCGVEMTSDDASGRRYGVSGRGSASGSSNSSLGSSKARGLGLRPRSPPAPAPAAGSTTIGLGRIALEQVGEHGLAVERRRLRGDRRARRPRRGARCDGRRRGAAARAAAASGIETRSGMTARTARAVSTTSLCRRAVTAATDAPVISRMPPARPKKPSTSTPGSPVADETAPCSAAPRMPPWSRATVDLAAVVGQQDQQRQRDQADADHHRAAAAAGSRARTAARRRAPRAAAP